MLPENFEAGNSYMYSYVKEYHRKGIFGDGRYSVEVRLALSWKIGAKKEKDHCLKCR